MNILKKRSSNSSGRLVIVTSQSKQSYVNGE